MSVRRSVQPSVASLIASRRPIVPDAPVNRTGLSGKANLYPFAAVVKGPGDKAADRAFRRALAVMRKESVEITYHHMTI
jgi:hypothetical protein